MQGPEDDAPALSTDSIFPIASVTKPLTATLVMQLVDEERGALLYVTHSEEQAAQADERLSLHSGRLERA